MEEMMLMVYQGRLGRTDENHEMGKISTIIVIMQLVVYFNQSKFLLNYLFATALGTTLLSSYPVSI